MILLAHPWRLLWLLPWAALCLLVLGRQLQALRWLEGHVAASRLQQLSRSSRGSLRLRLAAVFLTGALLVLALSGPYAVESGESVSEAATVILVFDASLSMGAPDAVRLSGDDDAVARITLAAEFARELVAAMPGDTLWGVISFSGEAVIHSPPTSDDFAIATLLNNQDVHIYTESNGSRFSAAFEAVVHLAEHAPGATQVVLLSDGELSHEDAYGDSLAALDALEIPVHTVGFGARSFMNMSVWVLEDVLAGAEEKRTAAEYQTRRESRELERMAEETGGRVLVVEHGDWVGQLAPALTSAPKRRHSIRTAVQVDFGRWLAGASVLAFLVFVSAFPDRRSLAGPLLALAAVSLVSMGCGHPLLRAHRLNERGLAELEAGATAEAASSFETSAAFGVRAHIPLYNLGTTAMLDGDLERAHSSFERALQLEPRLAEAHYNDARVLYLWGAAELDEERCQFARTRELWQYALQRFEKAELLASGELRRQASVNAEFMRQRLAELDELEARCNPPPPQPGEGGGGGGGGGEARSSEEPQPLSPEEQAQVAAELERIHSESSSAGGFHQSRTSQLDPEQVVEATGRKIWW